MTAPDILPARLRDNLTALEGTTSLLQQAVLHYVAAIEADVAAEYGPDVTCPMTLGKNFRKVLCALGDLSSEVANLTDEVELVAVEDERRVLFVNDERAAS